MATIGKMLLARTRIALANIARAARMIKRIAVGTININTIDLKQHLCFRLEMEIPLESARARVRAETKKRGRIIVFTAFFLNFHSIYSERENYRFDVSFRFSRFNKDEPHLACADQSARIATEQTAEKSGQPGENCFARDIDVPPLIIYKEFGCLDLGSTRSVVGCQREREREREREINTARCSPGRGFGGRSVKRFSHRRSHQTPPRPNDGGFAGFPSPSFSPSVHNGTWMSNVEHPGSRLASIARARARQADVTNK